ncbi:MAG: DUF5690 family protein [Cyclobacteriaceae bacterium]|jgi:hypothetical protein
MASESDKSKLTLWLQTTHPIWFTLFTALAAFSLYTCVYAFRKTFAVATFSGMAYAGISYKVWLVTFQVIGYALSKFIGIRVISELKAHSRATGILWMVTIAGISWLLFAITPAPYNIIFLFTNGLPLGMVWGMVFGYLEGRRMTEVLGAALAVSFIFSAGLCRSVGAFIMRDWGVTELWMPFVASLLFLLPLLLFLFLLSQVPAPSLLDEQLRTKRQPMDGQERNRFLTTFLPGIVLFVLAYVLLTAFRDFRDNFSAEIWQALGINDPSIYTATEVPVSLAVLVCMGSLMLFKNNFVAFMLNHVIIALGFVLIGVATYLFELHVIESKTWMVLIGLGLYLGYIPFNSIFFDRMIATFRFVGTVGFIMYVADSFGYLGSVGVLFYKEFGQKNLSWLAFFLTGSYVVAFAGLALIVASMIYFARKYRTEKPAP